MGWTDSAVRRYIIDAGGLLEELNDLVRADITTKNKAKYEEINKYLDEMEERIREVAEKEEIDIRTYSIIYDAINELKDAMEGLLSPDIKEEIVGSAEVQAIFKVSKVGKVAGSKVIDGEIANNLNARLIRDGNVLYTGAINSIFREKNAAKQVAAGLECGITLKDFADFKEKDVIEVYKIIETERRI